MANLNILRRLRTARHLSLSQLRYYILRRGLPARRVAYSGDAPLKKSASLVEPISVSGIYASGTEFSFLNVNYELGGSRFDWQPQAMSRLWQYNLHYFDYLRESERPLGNKKALIASWIENNQQNSQPGWEPFTVSLRIVNWIFFFLVEMRNEEVPQSWNNSLYEQVLWLEKNDEKHILANHYFENIKALLFASIYFDGKPAKRWLAKYQQALKEQIHEQFLSDGGHYEKSPMYHCLMLENCLDLYNLIANNRATCDRTLQSLLKSQIEYSLHWLSDVHYRSGEIPLFNDSAFAIAPDNLQLCQYASRLFLYQPEANIVSGGRLIELDASGYYGLETNADKFIIDCGDISPAYQPGHTHCDFLSYELALNDQMVVVDSGVYEYTDGEMRDYVRSTRAHNTISVDGGEQSEVWAAFRVARRAKKLHAHINQTDTGAVFSGGYEGFHAVPGNAKHLRHADINLNAAHNEIASLIVEDEVLFKGQHQAESYIHFHPSIGCEDKGDGRILLSLHGEHIANVMIDNGVDYAIESAYYCPEFGKRMKNKMIVLKRAGRNKVAIRYEINKV